MNFLQISKSAALSAEFLCNDFYMLWCCVGDSELVWHDTVQRWRKVWEDVNMLFSRNVHPYTLTYTRADQNIISLTHCCPISRPVAGSLHLRVFLTLGALQIPVIWDVLVSEAWTSDFAFCFHAQVECQLMWGL